MTHDTLDTEKDKSFSLALGDDIDPNESRGMKNEY